jgi:outer membrane protein TolC
VITHTHFRSIPLTSLLLLLLGAAPALAQIQTSAPQISDDSPFRGGVPTGMASPMPIALTLGGVIERALTNNLGIVTSEGDIDRARGVRRVAMSELLPNFGGRLQEARQITNLEAFGFPLEGTGLPKVVGPFNVFDVRVFLSQSIFDRHAISTARAEGHNENAVRFTNKSRRDLVSLLAADIYLQVLASQARAESARAQRVTAQALYTQAQDLRQGGIVAGIEVLRAQVRLSSESQRVTSTANDLQKMKLALAHMIGLPLGQDFTLDAELPDVSVPEITLEQALERAYMQRPDYLSAIERVRAAEAERSAAAGDALPAVHATADYGKLGLSPSSAVSTYTLVGSVTVPIFQGGRTQGRILQADAELKNRRAEVDNMRADIYYDIRNAFLDMQATEEQLRTSTEARELAAQQLTQSRDRFQAGVASNIEVVQAQEAVTIASEQYIDASYGFLMAKAMLAGSLGIAEDEIKRYLGLK